MPSIARHFNERHILGSSCSGGSGIKKVFVCRAGPYGVGAGGVVGTSGSLSSSLGAKSEACDGRGSTFRQTFF